MRSVAHVCARATSKGSSGLSYSPSLLLSLRPSLSAPSDLLEVALSRLSLPSFHSLIHVLPSPPMSWQRRPCGRDQAQSTSGGGKAQEKRGHQGNGNDGTHGDGHSNNNNSNNVPRMTDGDNSIIKGVVLGILHEFREMVKDVMLHRTPHKKD